MKMPHFTELACTQSNKIVALLLIKDRVSCSAPLFPSKFLLAFDVV